MRRYLLTILSTSCILFFACKKEKSEEPGGGGNAAGGLLTRMVSKMGTDSVSQSYGYDNQKRLISYVIGGAVNGFPLVFNFNIKRNAQGIIQTIVLKSPLYSSMGIDSVLNKVYYDAPRARYSALVSIYTDGSEEGRDSSAYTYNAAGRISLVESFYADGTTGGYLDVGKTEYTYDANGNIVKEKYYEFDETTNMYEALSESSYEYDNKVNPLILGNEAFLLGDLNLQAKNNRTKETYTDLTDPGNNESSTATYVYNNINKPVSATISGSIPITVVYSYQ